MQNSGLNPPLTKDLQHPWGLGRHFEPPLSFAVFNYFLPHSRNLYAIWMFFLVQNVPRGLISYFD
jgi:hypothetical protein